MNGIKSVAQALVDEHDVSRWPSETLLFQHSIIHIICTVLEIYCSRSNHILMLLLPFQKYHPIPPTPRSVILYKAAA